jgi:hypothetical protein
MGFNDYLKENKNSKPLKEDTGFGKFLQEAKLNEGVVKGASDVIKNSIKWIRLKSVSKKIKKIHMAKAHSQIAVYAAHGEQREKLEKQMTVANKNAEAKLKLLSEKMKTIAEGGASWFKKAIALAQTNAALDAGDVIIKALKKHKGGTKALDDAITAQKTRKGKKKELVLDIKKDVKKQEEQEKKLTKAELAQAQAEDVETEQAADSKKEPAKKEPAKKEPAKKETSTDDLEVKYEEAKKVLKSGEDKIGELYNQKAAGQKEEVEANHKKDEEAAKKASEIVTNIASEIDRIQNENTKKRNAVEKLKNQISDSRKSK